MMEARNLAIGYGSRSGKKGIFRSSGSDGESTENDMGLHAHLNFTLHKGEMVCLLGPNGAGKSTLLRTLASFQPPLAGELLYDGKPLHRYSERERSRRIGVVLTDKTQVGGLTVHELVALGRQPHTGFLGRLKEHDLRLVDEAIEAVGMTHKRHSYTAELSDGERQKAMIAKALVQECPLILLDEPTAFLDVVSRIEIMQLLHTIAHRQERTILLSTHDVEQALVFADRLWLLSREEGLRCGVTEDLLLADCMDTLFPGRSLRFDRERGGYIPLSATGMPIAVEAADGILFHWTQNALARNGYTALPAAKAPDTALRLLVRSPHDMELQQPTVGSGKYRSFEELLAALNRHPYFDTLSSLYTCAGASVHY